MSRKGGTGRGGWLCPKDANSIAMYGLGLEMPWLTQGGLFLSSYAQLSLEGCPLTFHV